jgi:hypothetical protein
MKRIFVSAIITLVLAGSIISCGGSNDAGSKGSGWITPISLQSMAANVYYLDTAISSSGRAVAVWLRENPTTTVPDVWASVFTTDWGWSSPVIIDTLSSVASWPKVAINDSGIAFATWVQEYGGKNYIFIRRYTPTTGWETVSPAIDVYRFNSGFDVQRPQIAMNAAGQVSIVFEYQDTSTSVWKIREHRIDDGAVTLWWNSITTNNIVEDDNAGDAELAQIAVASNGDSVAVWQKSDGVRMNIFASIYDDTTKNWGAPAAMESNPGDAEYPKVTMNSGGTRAMVVWHQKMGTSGQYVFYNQWVSGSGWNGPDLLQTYMSTNGKYPSVKMNANGDVIAAWQQYDGAIWRTWGRRATAASGWGAAVRFESDQSTTPKLDETWSPTVGIDALGNGVVLWDMFSSNNERPMRIYTNEFSPSTGWGNSNLLHTTDSPWSLKLVMNDSGLAIASWTQPDTGSQSVMMSVRY